MRVPLRAILMIAAALALVGCAAVEPHTVAKSPLTPIKVSPDAIMLEVFSAPAPQGSAQLDELWTLVDEQPLDPELRKRLAENGFRAGVVGPNVPAELARLLKVTDKPVAEEDKTKVPLNAEDDDVNLRLLYAKAGKRNELVLPHTRDQLTLLEHDGGHVRGKTYRQAECRLELRAHPEPDGRVRIDVTPEIHYGEFKSRVRGSDGMMRWTQERPKRVFHELKLSPHLAPGQMLLVASRGDRPSSAGYHFFTDTSGDKPVPKLWVVRAARETPDTAFYEEPREDDLGAVSNDLEE